MIESVFSGVPMGSPYFSPWVSLHKYLRRVKEFIREGDVDSARLLLEDMEDYLGRWFPWDDCFGDAACYAGEARVGSGNYCVYKTHVGFLADWWMELDRLPLVDEHLIRWASAVSLLLPSHNRADNIGLGISRWRNNVWRVHLILKLNEEVDALGANLLIALSMWLGEMWGADVEVSNMSFAEATVITFIFSDYVELPLFVRDLISFAGYNFEGLPKEMMVGRLEYEG